MNVADHYTEANSAISEHLMQPVLLPSEDPGQLLHLACDQAQAAKVLRRHKAPAQQATAGENRQPLGIG